MSGLNLSDYAAWWGAVVATVVLLFDAYKWFTTGAKLRVVVQPNMQTVVHGKLLGDLNIFVEVANNGDRTTTITHLVVRQFASRFDKLLNKSKLGAVVPIPGGSQPLPFELEPGKRWVGLIDQQELVEKGDGNGLTYCGIHHTASKKSILVRVELKE